MATITLLPSTAQKHACAFLCAFFVISNVYFNVHPNGQVTVITEKKKRSLVFL